jgi:hypothetical protein
MSEMEPQQAYQGFTPSSYGAVAVQVAVSSPMPPPMLRPLSTGEILDRTLALYRRHFWLFVGIGVVPGAMLTLSSGIRFLFLNTFMTGFAVTARAATPVMTPQQLSSIMLMQMLFFPALLLFLLAYGVAQAATVYAVEVMTRGGVMTAVDAYRAVKPHWPRWCGIVLRQVWTAMWPFMVGIVFLGLGAAASALAGTKSPVLYGALTLLAFVLMLAGLVFGVLNYIRVALAQAAGVVEDLGVNAALRRSRVLVAGRKGRIFLALLLVYVLQMVAGGLQLPFVFLAQSMHGAQRILMMATDMLIAFVAMSLVTPVLSIAMSLFYTDERVRREGYDIEVLLQRSIAEQNEAGAR